MKIFIAGFFILFTFLNAQAISITKVKGTKVLLNLQGAKVTAGQQLVILGLGDKQVALIKIISVKPNKALAVLVSGAMTGKEKVAGLTTSSSATVAVKATPTPPAAPVVPPKPEGPRVPYRASVLLGLASNTLSVRVTNGITAQDVDNTGNSISLALAVDRQYFQPWFRARAVFAYDQFNAIGASTISGCANRTSRDCQTDIKYLGAGLYGKFEKEYNQFNVWGAGGLNIKMPISKSSTALDESSLGATVSYGINLGLDYVLETKKFMTASLEKQIYIKSDTAETSTLFIRLGVGKEF